MSDFYSVVPYWLCGDPEKLVDGKPDYTSKGQVAVAVKGLSTRTHILYRKKFGCSLDLELKKCWYLIGEATQALKSQQELERMALEVTEAITAEENVETKTRLFEKLAGIEQTIRSNLYVPESDDEGNSVTPYGVCHGDLDEHMIHIATFLLAQCGKIVAENEDGTFQTEEITQDQIIDCTLPEQFASVDEKDGTNLFYEILHLTHVWDMKEAARRLNLSQEGDESDENFPHPKTDQNEEESSNEKS